MAIYVLGLVNGMLQVTRNKNLFKLKQRCERREASPFFLWLFNSLWASLISMHALQRITSTRSTVLSYFLDLHTCIRFFWQMNLV